MAQVHEMDLLPKHVCYSCIYKLDEFHKFYENCLRTDTNLKSQLSWMQKPKSANDVILPMVQINYPKLKSEPIECEDQVIPEIHVKEEKLTEYADNDLATYRDRIIDYPNNECLRCRCFFANGNRVNDHLICARLDGNSAKQNDTNKEEKYRSSRDTIKRNLFVNEISANRVSMMEQENSMERVNSTCSVIAKDNKESLVHSELSSSNDRPKVLMPKIELEDISKTTAFHTLIRKKNSTKSQFLSDATSDVLSSESKCQSTIGSTKITAACKDETKHSIKTEIKMEILDDFERSLRPRTDMIDYSEPGQKYHRARVQRKTGRVKKIKKSPSNTENEKSLAMKYENNKFRQMQNFNLDAALSSPILMVKLERQDFTKCPRNIRKMRKNSKMPLKPRNNLAQSSIETKEFTNVDISNEITSGKSYERKFIDSLNSESLATSCAIKVNNGKRKNTMKNLTTHSLRSHLEHIGNSNESTNIFTNVPKRMRQKNSISSRTIKRKRSRSTDKATGTIFKCHNCDKCNERFASPELYRLHCCYAIKRQ